jgi:hypothetical protein
VAHEVDLVVPVPRGVEALAREVGPVAVMVELGGVRRSLSWTGLNFKKNEISVEKAKKKKEGISAQVKLLQRMRLETKRAIYGGGKRQMCGNHVQTLQETQLERPQNLFKKI